MAIPETLDADPAADPATGSATPSATGPADASGVGSLAPAAARDATVPPAGDGASEEAVSALTQVLPAGTRLQDCEISGVVGRGGFGIVYEAVDGTSGERIAVKEYMPAQLATRMGDLSVVPLGGSASDAFRLGLRSFIGESRLLSNYDHPGLVKVLRGWEENGTAYMAMPFYQGTTLNQLIEREHRVIDERWLKAMLEPLLEALAHLHADGCYHRDVAPDNILIPDRGGAVLLDLGAARRTIGDRARALTVMLKPGFAPVEQYADDPSFAQGPWTDIYALSAVLYNAITGRPPSASATRLMRDSVVPLLALRPPGYGEEFLAAIDVGLSVRPEARPRTIGAFRSLLFAAPGSLPELVARDPAIDDAPPEGAGHPAAPGDFAQRRAREPRTSRAVICVALIAAITGGWWVTQSAQHPASHTAGGPETASAVIASGATRAAATSNLAMASSGEPSGAAGADAGPTPASAVAGSAPQSAVGPGESAQIAAPGATESGSAPAAAEQAHDAIAGTGTLRLMVDPWGEVFVDGVRRGVTPPLSRLTLAAGAHRIELRNPAAASSVRTVRIARDGEVRLRHHFETRHEPPRTPEAATTARPLPEPQPRSLPVPLQGPAAHAIAPSPPVSPGR